jgi:multidrug resistance protein
MSEEKSDPPSEVMSNTIVQDRPYDSSRSKESDVEKTPVSSDRPSGEVTIEAQTYLVDWAGPDDPEFPRNWPARKKWTNVGLLAALTLLTCVPLSDLPTIPKFIQLTTIISPFASSMFAPSVNLAMADFHDFNETIGTFSVSVYLLGYAFGPLILAPLSELYGRLVLYHISMSLFIVFNVACAESKSFPMLIVFRVLTGIAGSCPLTIGPGSISDMYAQEERGKIMSIWTLPIMLGPSIGPIAGGYLSASLGWRWDFWFLIIVVSALC